MANMDPVIDNVEACGVSVLSQQSSPIAATMETPAIADQSEAHSASHEEVDAELESKIQAALHGGSFPLRSVSVIVTQRRVLLIGWVSSFYLKQVAQESVRAIPGIRGLANRLVVTSS